MNRQSIFLLTFSPNSTILSNLNELLNLQLNQKLTNSSMNVLGLLCGISLYRVENSNVETEIAFLLGQNVLTPE